MCEVLHQPVTKSPASGAAYRRGYVSAAEDRLSQWLRCRPTLYLGFIKSTQSLQQIAQVTPHTIQVLQDINMTSDKNTIKIQI